MKIKDTMDSAATRNGGMFHSSLIKIMFLGVSLLRIVSFFFFVHCSDCRLKCHLLTSYNNKHGDNRIEIENNGFEKKNIETKLTIATKISC